MYLCVGCTAWTVKFFAVGTLFINKRVKNATFQDFKEKEKDTEKNGTEIDESEKETHLLEKANLYLSEDVQVHARLVLLMSFSKTDNTATVCTFFRMSSPRFIKLYSPGKFLKHIL